MSERFHNLDGVDQLFFARQLELVRAKTYDYKLPELRARKFIPIDNSAGPGVDSVTFSTFTSRGVAKFASAYADDAPRADVTGTQTTTQIKTLVSSYEYSIFEIQKARQAGLPLEQKRANAARRAIDEGIDSALAKGDGSANMYGFFNQPNALVYTVPNGAAASPLWSLKTPSEIIADLNAIENFIVQSTNAVEMPDTILLPIKQLLYIKSTPFAAGNASNVSILEMFLKNSIFVKTVDHWFKLTGAGTAGADLMICYKNDEDHLAGIVSQEFSQLAPEARNFAWVVNCSARVGGTQVFYPLSICLGSGI